MFFPDYGPLEANLGQIVAELKRYSGKGKCAGTENGEGCLEDELKRLEREQAETSYQNLNE